MTPSQSGDVAFTASQLTLALASLARLGRAPLARPLALFCFSMAAWSLASLIGELTGVREWQLIDRAISPLTGPLAVNVALTFDGRRRALRAPLGIVYALGGALGSLSIVALFVPDLRPFIGSRAWVALLLSYTIPAVAFAMLGFVSHLQRSVEPIEEERTRTVIAGLIVATVLGSVEPFAPNVAPLGKLGVGIATLTVVLVSLKFSWFEARRRIRVFKYVLAITGITVLVYIAAFGMADAAASRLLMGTTVVTLTLVAASRRWAAEAAVQKERVSKLASLGRFSAQIAHDIKNPLSALKGAAQLLRDDVAIWPTNITATEGPAPAELVELMLDQIDRISSVVDSYGRLARIELVRSKVDVNEVVRAVVALNSLANKSGVELRTSLAEGLPACSADRAMLASVVENLVRNALEASTAGSVTVRTERAREDFDVILSVEDEGIGMNANTRERAFDDFFSTKPTGSGLGLAFVQRVVQAHDGEVTLTSREGHGTLVRIRLPST